MVLPHNHVLELLSYLLCRDHRKLFVGDSRGRVFSWTVSDTQGSVSLFILYVCFNTIFNTSLQSGIYLCMCTPPTCGV